MHTVSRLFTGFKPSNYKLLLDLTKRTERSFAGTITITGQLVNPGDTITLHGKDLTITAAAIDGESVTSSAEAKNDEIILQGNAALQAGEHTITLKFNGKISDPMHGLYPCHFTLDGKKEELLATQFESHHAREVFPCIDEPEAKATFDLTLLTEAGITVLSNTPVAAQKENQGELSTAFETTPCMSTYLLAWVVGKLDYTEAKTKDGVVVRAYSTPDKVAHTAFASDIGAKIIDFYNDYFAIPYPLPKCDMIALPDFSSGAMENWGCITYRETALLVDEKNSAATTKQYVTHVVAHELAHQWFGNLVTMKWWDDLWLNESFATWVSYLACDHLFPEWQMWTQFVEDEVRLAMAKDGLANVQVVRQSVSHPDEIRTLFDPAIVYAKGASLLHMLHGHIGEKAFQEGLQQYLREHAYDNAIAEDLWQALTKSSGKDIGTFMTPWISQSGLPVVTVGVSEKTATLHQRRFYSNPQEAKAHDPTKWPIPLLADNKLAQDLLDVPSANIAITSREEPLLLNKGRSGYYISMYDTAHLSALAAAVRTKNIDAIDRLGLLNDQLNLTKAGLGTSKDMLQLLSVFAEESSLPVWSVMAGQISAVRMLIDDDEILKQKLFLFTSNLAQTQYKRLGWKPHKNEEYFDTLLRPAIISLMLFAHDKETVDNAKDLFTQAKNPEDILGDLRALVIGAAVKFGDKDAFEKALDWYSTTTSAEDRTRIIKGMTATEDAETITTLLEMLTTEKVRLQDIHYWFAYLCQNRYSRPATWQWLQDNWQWIEDKFASDMAFTGFAQYSAQAMSTPQELADYKAFFESKLDDPALGRAIRQGIEAIETRVQWRKRDIDGIKEFLNQ